MTAASRRPIPAKAGISLRVSANGGFALRRMRFRLSPEWRFFYIFGYRQVRYCPQRQKAPPFRRKPESPRRKAQNFPPPRSIPAKSREKDRPIPTSPVPFLQRQESPPPQSGGELHNHRLRRGDPCLRRNGTGGVGGFSGRIRPFLPPRPKYTHAAIPAKAGISLGEKK
ncbi:MAG: hypothetical protein ACR2QC_08845 [Gammaproteobacteria bacterium]